MRNQSSFSLLLLAVGGGSSASNAFQPAFISTNNKLPGATARLSSTTVDSDTATASTSTLSAADRYSGAGNAAVDMNRYNLPLDRAAEEWTANLTPGSALAEEGVYLGAKSKKELFVDTVRFEIKRAGGMGIELTEIAGGREDGLGITIVSGLVTGGNADGSGIVEGDSISMLEVKRVGSGESASSFAEVEESTAVSTECLGYDSTVDAILDLPVLEDDDETVVVTVKRLRRKPRVTVNLQYPPSQGEPDTTIELFAGENLRRAMLTRGVKLNDALSARFDSGGMGDCGAEGTCATCVVGISKGDELLDPIKQQEGQILAKNPRWRMACRTVVGWGMTEGEMTVKVNPRQWEE